MVKLSKLLLLLFVMSFFLISSVSAEIFLDQPSSIYNLGDQVTFSATVDSLSDNFFDMALNCDGSSVVITHDILSSTIIKKSFTLSSAFIGPLKGSCYVSANYGSSSVQSQSFTISDKTDAFIELDKKDVNPSDNIVIKISATKANGKPVNGYATVTFIQAGISLDLPVVNGVVIYNFSLPKNMPSGAYSIKTKVYEKDKQGNIINDVSLENNVFVKQEARKVEISINDQEAIPGEAYKFKIIVYDQTDQVINTQVRYSLLNGDDAKISDLLVNSNDEVVVDIASSETPGYRTIIASFGDLTNKRFFYIPQVERVSFEIINSTLIITNTGNVPYRKNVEVGIGGNKEIVDIKLDVGQSSSYNLQAPSGDYDISATDGVASFSAGGVALTGNAIRIVDIANDSSLLTRYSLVWLFILGVLGLFIYGVSKGLGKQKFFSYMPSLSSLKRVIKGDKFGNTDYSAPNISTIKSSDVTIGRILPKEAQHSLVIKGVKEPCSVVAVKISDKLKVDKSTISSISSQITSLKGSVYSDNDFVIGIFAPSATRTFKNENSALRVCEGIKSVLSSNKNIVFGIGVNHGDLVVEIDKITKKLKFTSIGPTISLAKKLADSSKGEVFLSSNIYRRVASSVKAKKTSGTLEAYELSSMVNRDDNSKFLESFKARNQYSG